MQLFRISETELDSGCRQVRIEGELDLSVVERLRERFDAAVQDDVEVLVCLDGCDFIDSSAIAAIVLARRELAKRRRRLVICDPSRPVSRVLEISGLDDDGFVYPSLDAALAERSGGAVAE